MTSPPPATAREAEEMTAYIRRCISDVGDQVNHIVEMLEKAHARKVHTALGYETFAQYVQDRFETQLRGLDRTDRIETTGRLTALGLGVRPLGQLLGVDPSTVSRDRQLMGGVADATPDTVGMDGKTYPRSPAVSRGRRLPRGFRHGTPIEYANVVKAIERGADRLAALHEADEFTDFATGLVLHRDRLLSARNVIDGAVRELDHAARASLSPGERRIAEIEAEDQRRLDELGPLIEELRRDFLPDNEGGCR